MASTRILGVTGGIGCGKSVVCAYLAQLGAEVFDADLTARSLMESDERVRQEVTRAFGRESYREDGSLNRKWLASQVFAEDSRLEELNGIVHPKVAEAFGILRNRFEGGLLVHEAALIYEAGVENRLDAVCVVTAPKELRIARVMARDRVSAEKVLARMSRQLSQEEKAGRADVVLVNDSDMAAVRSKSRRLYELAMSGEGLSFENFRFTRQL
ncbi:MAG: dephospho-CoA kinase [Rhodothermaceae bacterium]|nr:dephospho-CoA kinase [Bacteroidota bacterium]MXW82769.1 dephospho-CoA kinase [Rhodothermaceae bacterium]MXX58399.1 dephospho-CoA kinase [Rhodothermaceae bacterium]MYD20102.1 dephospho-CoA kinase [Rhodothermaceae bacterium]MYD56438.1 dephospho-CoA kinase [Rhodothermaceae bacterium]